MISKVSGPGSGSKELGFVWDWVSSIKLFIGSFIVLCDKPETSGKPYITVELLEVKDLACNIWLLSIICWTLNDNDNKWNIYKWLPLTPPNTNIWSHKNNHIFKLGE